MVRREITQRGRSRCMIAGQMVNVGDLKRLGELLADLHGQHEHQSLFHPSAQRAALDAFGAHEDLLAKYGEKYATYTGLARRREELLRQAEDFEKRLDYLTFQIEELEEVNPRAGELAELEADETRLSHAENLARAAQEAYAILYEGGDDDARTALSALGTAGRALDQIARLDPTMKDLPARIQELETLVQDFAAELRDYMEKCEPDPQRLEQIVDRVDAIKRLMRKHAATTEEELAAKLAKLLAERDRMNLDERERNEIEGKLARAKEDLIGSSDKLTKARAAAAKTFSAEVMKTLAQVGMEKANFTVDLARAENAEEFGPDGADRIEFLLAANVGEGTNPLRSVASGGELSRVMLAIKTALAARDAIATLVFDEIDAGISGQTAARVGRLMEKLAESHQIICITHHASIAARATHHLSVRKSERQGRTVTSVLALGAEERVEELAQMMGDEGQSAAGRKLAKQLMETV
ncbi:DNA repair protein RecN, partial [Candidatus Sumerlaeota bacterium]|nr:DNA repair protein RecN [Candidatus Sumerlaeota bacterium]